jgi:hypothetical protein
MIEHHIPFEKVWTFNEASKYDGDYDCDDVWYFNVNVMSVWTLIQLRVQTFGIDCNSIRNTAV